MFACGGSGYRQLGLGDNEIETPSLLFLFSRTKVAKQVVAGFDTHSSRGWHGVRLWE